MIVQIYGSRQRIAELAQELRLRGYRFDNYIQSGFGQVEKPSLTTSATAGSLKYYKFLEPDEVFSGKKLQAQLPSHRKHFIKLVEENREPTRSARVPSEKEHSRPKVS